MDASFKAAFVAKSNAEELQKLLVEMSDWEKEIKEKEYQLTGEEPATDLPLPRNRRKSETPKKRTVNENVTEKKKIAAYDYDAWDKFDVDEACKEIDQNNAGGSSVDQDSIYYHNTKTKHRSKTESKKISLAAQNVTGDIQTEQKKTSPTAADKTDSSNLQNIDAAHFEKELGNKFVREQKWQDAIECYSRAIELKREDPIFHANRALCYLKLGNFKVAEVDSTIAIQLDGTYMKAYHRRALARKGLQQYKEAIEDFEKVLELDPSNVAASSEVDKIKEFIAKIGENPTNVPIFDAKKVFGNEKTNKLSPEVVNSKKNQIDQAMNAPKASCEADICNVFSTSLPANAVPIFPVIKPPHLRSKEPLQHVEIKQVNDTSSFERLVAQLKVKEVEKPVVENVEAIPPAIHRPAESPAKVTLPGIPRTYVQLESYWKTVSRHPALSYQFLKALPLNSLRSLIGSSLDSAFFSDVLRALAQDECLQDPLFVFQFLQTLSTVERFKSQVMFLSAQDQDAIRKCFAACAACTMEEDIKKLRAIYEL